MTRILLVRHGHVDGIKPDRFRGRADLSLTALGEAQAAAVARRVASSWRVTRIYSSPARRCLATAAAISDACGVENTALDTLNDIDCGDWQLQTYEEVKSKEPALFAAWFATPHLIRFPNGESLQDLAARAADALRYILAAHRGDTVVLVAHDSVNRAMLLQLLDQPLSAYWRLAQDPCCLNEIEVTDGAVRVLRINDAQHLEEVARLRQAR
jgi:probable phosphoglycerate mutase